MPTTLAPSVLPPDVFPLQEGDTIPVLVLRKAERDTALRQERINGAKTGHDQLVAAGVISYDDGLGEWERAMKYTRCQELAKAMRVHWSEVDTRRSGVTARSSIRALLTQAVRDGETRAEFNERVRRTQAGAYGVKDNGEALCPQGHEAGTGLAPDGDQLGR